MPIYTPPQGRLVELKFEGVYTPPNGRAATLNFVQGGSDDAVAAFATTTGHASAVVAAAITAPATLVAVAEDAGAACAVAVFYPAFIAATTEDAAAEVLVLAVHYVDIAAATEDSTAAAEAVYDANVWRGIIAAVGTGWGRGDAAGLAVNAKWQAVDRLFVGLSLGIDQAGDVRLPLMSGWESTNGLYAALSPTWGDSNRHHATATSRWRLPTRQGLGATDAWQDTELVRPDAIRSVWDAPPHKNGATVFSNDAPAPLGTQCVADVSAADRAAMGRWVIPWGQATRLWIVTPPEPPIPPTDKEWPATLVFLCRKPYWIDGRYTTLIFKLIGCPWPYYPFIPKQKVYYVLNSATLVRLPDMTELYATSITINADVDSWAWRFNAAFKTLDQIDLVRPDANGDNREIRATINGESWDFVVEGVSESRQFGATGFSISGRSLSAYFAPPYAPVTSDTSTQDMTANQLAEAQLANTDWTVDWQLQDWLIPTGVWSQVGTPMAKILAVAEAVNAVVLTDRQAHIIEMMRRYPVLPWEWAVATPHTQIPINIMTSLAGDVTTKPDYNGVYVSGQSAGVVTLVKRTGSAGDVLAPMRVHPLLTHIDANRMAGEAILSEVGRIQRIPLSMPIEDILGVIPVNVLLEIDDNGSLWRGLTRSVSVTAT